MVLPDRLVTRMVLAKVGVCIWHIPVVGLGTTVILLFGVGGVIPTAGVSTYLKDTVETVLTTGGTDAVTRASWCMASRNS